jgi:Domain of unknown function (DUF4296)
MRNLLLYLCFICAVASGCKGDKPVDLVEQPKMVQVLAAIHIADALAERNSPPDKLEADKVRGTYAQVYIVESITETQFRSSYKYYEAHPDLMFKMYDEVIAELSKRQAEVNKTK